jgi:hypothetical protein
MGCTKKKLPLEGKAWGGGKGGYIDKSGEVVEGPLECQEFKKKYWSWLGCTN